MMRVPSSFFGVLLVLTSPAVLAASTSANLNSDFLKARVQAPFDQPTLSILTTAEILQDTGHHESAKHLRRALERTILTVLLEGSADRSGTVAEAILRESISEPPTELVAGILRTVGLRLKTNPGEGLVTESGRPLSAPCAALSPETAKRSDDKARCLVVTITNRGRHAFSQVRSNLYLFESNGGVNRVDCHSDKTAEIIAPGYSGTMFCKWSIFEDSLRVLEKIEREAESGGVRMEFQDPALTYPAYQINVQFGGVFFHEQNEASSRASTEIAASTCQERGSCVENLGARAIYTVKNYGWTVLLSFLLLLLLYKIHRNLPRLTGTEHYTANPLVRRPLAWTGVALAGAVIGALFVPKMPVMIFNTAFGAIVGAVLFGIFASVRFAAMVLVIGIMVQLLLVSMAIASGQYSGSGYNALGIFAALFVGLGVTAIPMGYAFTVLAARMKKDPEMITPFNGMLLVITATTTLGLIVSIVRFGS